MSTTDTTPVHVVRCQGGRTFRARLDVTVGGFVLTVDDVELAYALTPPRFPVDRQGRLIAAPSRPVGPDYLEAAGRALQAFTEDGLLGAGDDPDDLAVLGNVPDVR